MGQPKQLLPLGNKPVIRHCIDTIITAGIQEIVVVVNPRVQASVEALSGLPICVAVNYNDASDMAGSARIGLQALNQSSSGVLMCLADHPLASAETMKTLIREHADAPHKIVIPAHSARRGHPTLFPTSILSELFVVDTLRDIVQRDCARVRVIDVPDQGVILDMDTPEDYEKMLRRAGMM